MSVEVMPSSHLILCRPFLLLPSIFPSVRVFSKESVLHIRWPKYWSFSFSISPSNEYSGLFSFRIDWLGLLAVQGILKSLQHHMFKSTNSSALSFFSSPTLISIQDYWKNHSFPALIPEVLLLQASITGSWFMVSNVYSSTDTVCCQHLLALSSTHSGSKSVLAQSSILIFLNPTEEDLETLYGSQMQGRSSF